MGGDNIPVRHGDLLQNLLHRCRLQRCGWGRNRTADTRIFSPLLCQLSYPAVARDWSAGDHYAAIPFLGKASCRDSQVASRILLTLDRGNPNRTLNHHIVFSLAGKRKLLVPLALALSMAIARAHFVETFSNGSDDGDWHLTDNPDRLLQIEASGGNPGAY